MPREKDERQKGLEAPCECLLWVFVENAKLCGKSHKNRFSCDVSLLSPANWIGNFTNKNVSCGKKKKIVQDERKNLNRFVSIKDLKLSIKIIFYKENSRPRWFHLVNSFKHLRKKYYDSYNSLLENRERRFPNSF